MASTRGKDGRSAARPRIAARVAPGRARSKNTAMCRFSGVSRTFDRPGAAIARLPRTGSRGARRAAPSLANTEPPDPSAMRRPGATSTGRHGPRPPRPDCRRARPWRRRPRARGGRPGNRALPAQAGRHLRWQRELKIPSGSDTPGCALPYSGESRRTHSRIAHEHPISRRQRRCPARAQHGACPAADHSVTGAIPDRNRIPHQPHGRCRFAHNQGPHRGRPRPRR